MSARVLEELATGLATRCADHPAWAPGHGWARSVRAYLVAAEDATVLVDPIEPADGWDELDEAIERHVPALRRWLDDPIDHVLTAHGAPVVAEGGRELEAALARPPRGRLVTAGRPDDPGAAR